MPRLPQEEEPTPGERIHAGLLAYAAGDALGVPWEGRPPDEIPMDELELLPARRPWPPGATSDDTALTLLVAEHLAEAGGLGRPLRLLEALAARAPEIPGLGPSTRRAIEHFLATGRPDDRSGDTNGAPMRALPIGWAVPVADGERRRAWTLALTRLTHTGDEALTAACVMAACAAWAVDGASARRLVEVAADETVTVGPGTAVAAAVEQVAEGGWEPPPAGISLAPAETVAAVLATCLVAGDPAVAGDGRRRGPGGRAAGQRRLPGGQRPPSAGGSGTPSNDHRHLAGLGPDGGGGPTVTGPGLAAALRRAVGFGGDTDTVAALVGGLLGVRLTPADVERELPWLPRVRRPPPGQLARLAAALAEIRLAATT